ncbi:MAG: cytoskeletal protein CcmA (bactofilin family) [Halioglobus sp.]|jgi:cytoskeletal protein CcmA (bactofilin family)
MLGSKKSTAGSSRSTTLISHDTVIVGDVHFCGSLDVEGLVQGNIVAQPDKDALVRVVGKGRVEGDIRSPCIVINGAVHGDVHSSQQLELAAKGRVQGNVFYTLVEMAAGSEVNGSLTHITADSLASADKALPESTKAGPSREPKTPQKV